MAGKDNIGSVKRVKGSQDRAHKRLNRLPKH
jgi:hypothetical protein